MYHPDSREWKPLRSWMPPKGESCRKSSATQQLFHGHPGTPLSHAWWHPSCIPAITQFDQASNLFSRGTFSFILLLILLPIMTAVPAVADPDGRAQIIRLATTTSTDNSGLLRALLPAFEKSTGYRVHVIAVGTGKALRMGRDGDVDLVLVHARQAEKRFVEAGFGERRFSVMYNDFVLVGPASDPAGIRDAATVDDAFRRLARSEHPFISRGDDSGTHRKELALWKSAGVEPGGTWYREAGQGMGKVLQMAGELEAYTLTDRGTWLAMKRKLPLALLHQGDPLLFNPYGIIAVNPGRHPNVNHAGAMALIRWLTGPEGQARIAAFTIDGSQLFRPDARSGEVALLKP